MFQSFGFFYRKQAVASIRMASRKARRGGAIKVSFQGVDSLPPFQALHSAALY